MCVFFMKLMVDFEVIEKNGLSATSHPLTIKYHD